jgi:hypothetical protein
VNVEGMREFYERAGYRVATTAHADWYVPGNRIYRNFPCGRTVVPTPEEIAQLCRHKGILGVEFGNARGIGVGSGVWKARDPAYGLDSLQRQFRQQLQRAQEREHVREIGFDELARLASAANLESLARLGLADRRLAEPARWRRICQAGAATPGAGAFATFGPDGLTAYLIHFTVDDTCYGLISKSRDVARHSGANHLLYFTYTQAMLRRPGIAAVSLGVQSVPPLAGVDRMKRHAGYLLEPFALAVYLRPGARRLVTGAAGALALRVGERIFARSDAIRRARALRHMIQATADGERTA